MKNKFRIIIFAFVLLLLVLAFLFYKGYLQFNYPSKKKYPIWGIDISHHQGKIDWQKLKSEDIIFVFMKATEGGDYKDSIFTENWKAAIDNGFVVGAYHFYNLSKPGIEQANNFIATVPTVENALPPVLDLEFSENSKANLSHAEIISGIKDFLVAVRKQYHKTPIIYTTNEFYRQYIQNDFKDCEIWIRNIFSEPKLIDNRHWLFWQFSSRENLDGIDGEVDENVFNGNKTDFQKLLIPVNDSLK